MDTWDNARPDRDQPTDGASAIPEEGSRGTSETTPAAASKSSAASEEEPYALPELRRALNIIADHYTSVPQPDLFPKVMARATRIRRRNRAIRAVTATAALVVAAILGPSVASELGVRGGDASAAPPPSAIVDLTSAYPVTAAAQSGVAVAMPTQPDNALNWPSRGTTVPAQAVDVAKSYLLDHAGSSATSATATVTTLWAQVDADTTVPSVKRAPKATPMPQAQAQAPQKAAHKTWLYVMQGWTNGPDGTPSQAELLVGDYTQTGKASSMSVYSSPVTFAHPRPGSADDIDDVQQIAELSVYLPQSDRLVVLGTPQTETVLYAKTGGDLVPQKTDGGVAVFPRTKELVKGHYADTIQVRDAKNVALTPPKAWSAADFVLSGMMSLWNSAGNGWVTVPLRSGAARPTQDSGTEASSEPSTGPSAEPSTGPPTQTQPPRLTPTGAPSVTPPSPSESVGAATAPSGQPTDTSGATGLASTF
ncbi:hypothetical protein Caci_1222 [Catenulispora acidiphila DSM 44928]|uniref:Uncharacterized protein n=1 Tax=Catenulispora acidiphila (strain DSM 44928 / JCM 14897 / NBRC 102108 / NRRL B-24433 / ID139908) TaxID=479433 RepID=C7Q759_CATAD|nr:hypothetical protein [Catenulispora acidiphila]ACU70147.1 hypothetical protein Caci_1222 [Catenulispora acidiphila DSM 44928]